jgi:hypothetical protein
MEANSCAEPGGQSRLAPCEVDGAFTHAILPADSSFAAKWLQFGGELVILSGKHF